MNLLLKLFLYLFGCCLHLLSLPLLGCSVCIYSIDTLALCVIACKQGCMLIVQSLRLCTAHMIAQNCIQVSQLSLQVLYFLRRSVNLQLQLLPLDNILAGGVKLCLHMTEKRA